MKDKSTEKYWRSREELASSRLLSDGKRKDVAEFPSPPLKEESSPSRREFLKIMGAGMALAGSSCMRRPTEKIVPYVHRPEEIIPGKALYYASSFYDSGEGFSTLVKTREGRPIKMEGNEQAELLNGRALSPRAEACILSLYDPERAKGPMQNLFNEGKTNKETIRANFTEMDKSLTDKFKEGRTALLSPRIPSPSHQALVQTFCSVFKAKTYVWDPLSHESFIEGQRACYQKALAPSYNIDRAKFIFSLNCDFLGTWLSPVEFQRQFAKGRRPAETGEMSRLVVLESLMSLTGSNADERFRIGLQDQLPALCALTQALYKKAAFPPSFSLPENLKSILKSYEDSALKIPERKWAEWAEELIRHRGESLILFGGLRGQTPQALETHILVNFLNSALQNDGRTVNYRQSYPYEFGSYSNMDRLIDELETGAIKHLIIHGVNPLYSYPESDRFLKALKKADLVVYTGDRMDETGSWSHFLIPDSHPLEKWSDWEFKKGLFSIQQPTIRPLYKTRAFEDSLIQWMKLAGSNQISSKNFYEYIKNRWERGKMGRPGHSSSWETFLKKGLSGEEKNLISSARPFNTRALKQLKAFKKREGGEVFLSLYESSGIKQGDMSNNAWLMEFPDPVSKICWENYLSISPAMALKKQLKEGDVVALATAESSVLAPVHIQPGQEDTVLSLAVGYGRQKAGSVGNNKGVNAFPLIDTKGKRSDKERGGFISAGKAVLIEKTPHSVPLANVGGHHSMEGRDIILETTLQEFKKDPSSGLPHHHKVPSLWSKHKYKGHKWGMVIDLNSCTGCGTCMIACQSENNIPTVGKEYVLQGREMHWIRVDRYYKGPEENPEALHQPVVCMHCDNAPCETVCPVLATVHSDEGTNDMVYNRCVGTRYCSNNCPYKVRRFNWFDYTKQSKEEPLKLALNPDVTVRHRGVMEKCSFCIQKIHEGKAQAKREGRELKDGDVKTACQQSCPSEAIIFGDLNHPESKVSQAFQAKNSYALLDDMLNTKPAVKYLTKVRNRASKASPSSFHKEGGKKSSHH